jgi:hypothetical protein
VLPARGPLPLEPLDLADPANLTLALQLRATEHKKVILFGLSAATGRGRHLDDFWMLLAQNMVARLHSTGFDHYIALASSPKDCRTLHERWPIAGVVPSCAYSSEPYHLAQTSGGGPDLCIGRYWILGKIAERGFDVFLTDLDVTIHHDFHELIDSPPLNNYVALFMAEGPVNSGTTFVRGTRAHPHGGVLWTIREITRRDLLLHQYMHQGGDNPGTFYDQGILGFALGVASTPGLSEWDWWEQYSVSKNKESNFWKIHPQHERKAFKWKLTTEHYSTPWPDCPSQDASVCERWENFKKRFELVGVPFRTSLLCTPFDSPYHDGDVPCEPTAAGPTWLWAHGEVVSHGWAGASASTHWLGIEKTWCENFLGSHTGRFNVMLAAGFIDLRLMSLPHARERRAHTLAWTHGVRQSYKEASSLLTSAFQSAVEAGIPFSVPELPCDAPWITKSDLTRSGILDWRVIETPDGRCWPAPPGWNTCFSHHHYAYDFMMLEPNRTELPLRQPLSDAELKSDCRGWNGVFQ